MNKPFFPPCAILSIYILSIALCTIIFILLALTALLLLIVLLYHSHNQVVLLHLSHVIIDFVSDGIIETRTRHGQHVKDRRISNHSDK